MLQAFSHKIPERSLARKGLQPSSAIPATPLCALMAMGFYAIHSGEKTPQILKPALFIQCN